MARSCGLQLHGALPLVRPLEGEAEEARDGVQEPPSARRHRGVDAPLNLVEDGVNLPLPEVEALEAVLDEEPPETRFWQLIVKDALQHPPVAVRREIASRHGLGLKVAEAPEALVPPDKHLAPPGRAVEAVAVAVAVHCHDLGSGLDPGLRHEGREVGVVVLHLDGPCPVLLHEVVRHVPGEERRVEIQGDCVGPLHSQEPHHVVYGLPQEEQRLRALDVPQVLRWVALVLLQHGGRGGELRADGHDACLGGEGEGDRAGHVAPGAPEERGAAVGDPDDGVVAPRAYPPVVEEEVVRDSPQPPEGDLVLRVHGLPREVGGGHHEGRLTGVV